MEMINFAGDLKHHEKSLVSAIGAFTVNDEEAPRV